MNVFICLAFLAVTFVSASVTVDKCFDKEKIQKELDPILKDCGFSKDDSKDKKKEAFDCAMKKKGIMDDEGKIVVAKFKEWEKPFILKNEDEIMHIADHCCLHVDKCELDYFIPCLKRDLKSICPLDKGVDEE